MKIAFSLLVRLLMTLCLAVYASSGIASSGGNSAVVSMEICANGLTKTVFVDANGVPVAPVHDCQDCQLCADPLTPQPTLAHTLDLSVPLLARVAGIDPFATLFAQNRNSRPMPRGPPAAAHTVLTLPILNTPLRDANGLTKRSDGRPFFKDATA